MMEFNLKEKEFFSSAELSDVAENVDNAVNDGKNSNERKIKETKWNWTTDQQSNIILWFENIYPILLAAFVNKLVAIAVFIIELIVWIDWIRQGIKREFIWILKYPNILHRMYSMIFCTLYAFNKLH